MSKNEINVAVVDDDESFARALDRLFRAAGFCVRTYRSAETFLDTTTLPQPDCLVLDMQLGGMSGLDLQRHLREIGAPVPIIFVTAHDTPEVRVEAERGGCAAYFLKPVPGESIIKAITKAVHPGSGKSNGHAANKPQ